MIIDALRTAGRPLATAEIVSAILGAGGPQEVDQDRR